MRLLSVGSVVGAAGFFGGRLFAQQKPAAKPQQPATAPKACTAQTPAPGAVTQQAPGGDVQQHLGQHKANVPENPASETVTHLGPAKASQPAQPQVKK